MIGGSPGVVEDAAEDLARAGGRLAEVGEVIRAHGRAVTADWHGDASDAAAERIDMIGAKVLGGADAVVDAAPVYREYAAELRAAQADYAAGQELQAAGLTAAGAAADQGRAAAARAGTDPARAGALAAAGAAGARADAQATEGAAMMAAAVQREAVANEHAARLIRAVTERVQDMRVPPTSTPSYQPAGARPLPATTGALLGDVGSSYEHGRGLEAFTTAPSAGSGTVGLAGFTTMLVGGAGDAGDPSGESAQEVVESALDYYADNPDQTVGLAASALAVVIGARMAAAGASMVGGGAVATAGGPTAVVGAPVAVAGAAVAATGVVIAGAGVISAVDNVTTMLDQRHTGGGGNSGWSSAPSGNSIGGHSVSDLSAAGRAPDRNGLTVAGRSLQKHGDREGSAFPPSTGNPRQRNEQGQEVLDAILNDPQRQVHVGARGTTVWDSTGRSVRFTADGRFDGFTEPN